ncbi:MAG: tetratricopeptide repeat protein, partial [Halieaceae bacterium]|nr:tetratricopeptide repeat protein [Halieaceae bacterium]
MVDDPSTLLARASHAFRASRHQDCLNICRSLLERSPDNAEALFLVAQAAQQVGDNGLADRAFRMLINLRPPRSEHWLAYASFLRRHKLLEPAEALLRDLLKTSPKLSPAWHMLGLCLFDGGRFQEAADAAQKSHQIDPARSQGWELAAAARQRMGDLSGAIETCR